MPRTMYQLPNSISTTNVPETVLALRALADVLDHMPVYQREIVKIDLGPPTRITLSDAISLEQATHLSLTVV